MSTKELPSEIIDRITRKGIDQSNFDGMEPHDIQHWILLHEVRAIGEYLDSQS